MNWKVIVVILLVIDIFIPFIFNIIGISQQNYLNYIIWINAIIVFYIVLPNSKGTIFD
jgi:uncharacterized membrane protein